MARQGARATARRSPKANLWRSVEEAAMSESEDWKERLVARPDGPFEVGLSRLGSGEVAGLACVGAALGVASGGRVWNEDGTLAITADEFRAGQLGILVLDPETGHAPFELCLSAAGVKALRVLLARLDEAMEAKVDRMVADVAAGRVEPAAPPEFLPDEVDPGRTH